MPCPRRRPDRRASTPTARISSPPTSSSSSSWPTSRSGWSGSMTRRRTSSSRARRLLQRPWTRPRRRSGHPPPRTRRWTTSFRAPMAGGGIRPWSGVCWLGAPCPLQRRTWARGCSSSSECHRNRTSSPRSAASAAGTGRLSGARRDAGRRAGGHRSPGGGSSLWPSALLSQTCAPAWGSARIATRHLTAQVRPLQRAMRWTLRGVPPKRRLLPHRPRTPRSLHLPSGGRRGLSLTAWGPVPRLLPPQRQHLQLGKWP
mmetsp:Transcript_25987/g.70320  ORF Transcript_25987/g.70320 Transcript_25987/m.70320 type:complete len:258 (+) Transcript_25987:150-923(+)